ncbi:MAG: DUF2461 domain-containing protein [Fimbriimonadaceae bacterium]|nr:DUF2461 domain-containing protein [Chitinophagales bacterium]
MPVIEKSTIDFLKKLKSNNNKEWFDKNRKTYETAKANFLEFTTSLIKEVEKFDRELKGIEAKKTIFRINRDIRFSKDKSPYKVNLGTGFSKGGKLDNTAGYYFHLQPGESFCAGGCYMPMPPQLSAIRQEIDYNFPAFKKMLSAKEFKKYYSNLDTIEKLKTVPKGYSADNPALEYLKHKSFIVSKYYADKEITSEKFLSEITNAYKALHPMVNFLNKAITE